MTSLEMVTQFHRLFCQRIAEEPDLSDEAVNDLRYKLIREELQELSEALLDRDPVAVLDALVDIEYVLMGSYLSLGFAKYREAALQEVHRANLSKLGENGKPIYLPSGKVTKGPNYSPPNLADILDPPSPMHVDFDDAKTSPRIDLGEPKTTDYCVRCGDSPDSGRHWQPSWSGGCDYVDPRTGIHQRFDRSEGEGVA